MKAQRTYGKSQERKASDFLSDTCLPLLLIIPIILVSGLYQGILKMFEQNWSSGLTAVFIVLTIWSGLTAFILKKDRWTRSWWSGMASLFLTLGMMSLGFSLSASRAYLFPPLTLEAALEAGIVFLLSSVIVGGSLLALYKGLLRLHKESSR